MIEKIANNPWIVIIAVAVFIIQILPSIIKN